MADQNVSFVIGSDTGEDVRGAIQPIQDGDRVDNQHFTAAGENLRLRTEIIRTALEDQKYLNDADRSLLLSGGGSILWKGIDYGPGAPLGTFTITADMVLRPFAAPALCTPAILHQDSVTYSSILAPSSGINPPRAYSGANKYTISFVGAVDAVLGIALDPLHAKRFILTVNTDAAAGTTVADIVTLLTTPANAYTNAGFTASGTGSAVLYPAGTGLPTSALSFTGAADAEQHVITAAGLANFFAMTFAAIPGLQEGDVICVSYDSLVMDPTFGGRRQSLNVVPESSSNVDSNLFVLRLQPEKLPLSLPIATVVSNKLIFINGAVLTADVAGSLDGKVTYAGSLATTQDAVTGLSASADASTAKHESLLLENISIDHDSIINTGLAVATPYPHSTTLAHIAAMLCHDSSFYLSVSHTHGVTWPEGYGTPAGLAVACNATHIVVVGAARLAYYATLADTTTWNAITLPGTPAHYDLKAITWAADLNLWCAVGADNMSNNVAFIASSVGGAAPATWTLASNTPGLGGLFGVARGGGYFVATTNTGAVLVSANGDTWNSRTATTVAGTWSLGPAVCYSPLNGGKFVIGGSCINGGTYTRQILTSAAPDASNAFTSVFSSPTSTPGAEYLLTAICTEKSCVTVWTSKDIRSSYDNVTWISRGFTLQPCTGAAWDGTRIIAVASAARLLGLSCSGI